MITVLLFLILLSVSPLISSLLVAAIVLVWMAAVILVPTIFVGCVMGAMFNPAIGILTAIPFAFWWWKKCQEHNAFV